MNIFLDVRTLSIFFILISNILTRAIQTRCCKITKTDFCATISIFKIRKDENLVSERAYFDERLMLFSHIFEERDISQVFKKKMRWNKKIIMSLQTRAISSRFVKDKKNIEKAIKSGLIRCLKCSLHKNFLLRFNETNWFLFDGD